MSFAVIILGACSIIWQFVILRELQITFQGNELSLSIILFCWLSGLGIGGALSNFFPRGKKLMASALSSHENLIRLLQHLQLLNAFLCFYSLWVCRAIKPFLGISPFEIVQPLAILSISGLAILPQTMCMGLSFIFLCTLMQNPLKAYYREALGAFLAGLLSLIAVKYLSSSGILWLCACSFIVAGLLLKPKSKLLHRLFSLALIFMLLAASGGALKYFEHTTSGLRYKPHTLEASLTSVYGALALTRDNQHYSLYENGRLAFTTEDTEPLEEFAHMILLQHLSPKKILLVGTASDELLRQLLQHPIETIDYVEPDEKLIQAMRSLSQENSRGFDNPKVHVYHSDARFFIKTTSNHYDCVIVSTADPGSLQQNRFYTLEFFREIKRVLHNDGICSISFSSKEDILTGQIVRYNASLYKTFKEVFPALSLIPGERLILIGSRQPLEKNSPQGLIARFKERNIITKYFTPEYITARLWRKGYVEQQLNNTLHLVSTNRDYSPYGFFYYLGIYSKQSWLNFKYLWHYSERMNTAFWLILILLFTFFFRKRARELAVFTSGAYGIALSVIISFIFQINFGFLYYRLGAIVASFMLGLSTGSIFAMRLSREPIREGKWLSLLEFSLGIAALLACSILKQQQPAYFLFSLLIGFLIGSEFGIFYTRLKTSTVYMLDVAGAGIGSLWVGLLAIPIVGIFKTCALIALVKCLSAVLFLRKSQR